MAEPTTTRRDTDQKPDTKVAGGICIPCQAAKAKKEAQAKIIDKITITCHKRACPAAATFFELVPPVTTTLPYTDRTTIVWTGPNIPPSIKVTGLGEIKGGGTYIVPFNFERKNAEKEAKKEIGEALDYSSAGYKNGSKLQAVGGLGIAAGLTLKALMKEMWTYNQYKSYAILGPMGSLPVKVYNPEKWTLTIKFPKLKSFSCGLNIEKELKTQKVTTTLKGESSVQQGNKYSANVTGNNTYTNKETKIVVSTKGGKVVPSPKDDEPSTGSDPSTAQTGDYITISRDGSPLKFDVFGSISALLKLIETIYSIVDLIKEAKDLVPTVGIDFNIDAQVMSGNFQLEWAWKEYTDHQAYYNIKPSINVKLLSGSIELAFGVKAPGFKAQAYISGGLEVPLTIEFENIKPGAEWYSSLQAQGKISVVLSLTVGAKFEVAYFLNINPLVTAGISLNGGVTGISEFGINADIKFTGLIAKLESSVGTGGGHAKKRSFNVGRNDIYADGDTGSDSVVLMQAFKWKEWKFPDKSDATKPISDSGFATIIEDMLSGETNHNGPVELVRIKAENERTWYTSNKVTIDLKLVATRIALKASKSRLKRTDKVLEAIANEVRNELLIIESKGWYNGNYVTLDELDKFIDGGQLAAIFSRNEDPTLCIK